MVLPELSGVQVESVWLILCWMTQKSRDTTGNINGTLLTRTV
jgi:hypothetical protein